MAARERKDRSRPVSAPNANPPASGFFNRPEEGGIASRCVSSRWLTQTLVHRGCRRSPWEGKGNPPYPPLSGGQEKAPVPGFVVNTRPTRMKFTPPLRRLVEKGREAILSCAHTFEFHSPLEGRASPPRDARQRGKGEARRRVGGGTCHR